MTYKMTGEELACIHNISANRALVNQVQKDMLEIQNCCVLAINMQPDLINFQNNNERWNKIKNSLNNQKIQQQKSYQGILSAQANLWTANKILESMYNDITKNQNQEISLEKFNQNAQEVKDICLNALNNFKIVQCQALEGQEQFIEQLTTDIGSNELIELQKQLSQFEIDVNKKIEDLNQYVVLNSDQKLLKSQEVARLEGFKVEQKILEESILESIKKKQSYLENLLSIQNQLEFSLTQNTNEMENLLNELLNEQISQSNSLKQQLEKDLKQLQENADEMQKRTNEEKQKLLDRINNPRQVAVTTRTYHTRKRRFLFVSLGSRVRETIETRWVFEDITVFRASLSKLLEVEQKEADSINQAKQRTHELAQKQQEDLKIQIKGLQDCYQANNNYKKNQISEQLEKVSSDVKETNKSIEEESIQLAETQKNQKNCQINIEACHDEMRGQEQIYNENLERKQSKLKQLIEEQKKLDKRQANILQNMGYSSVQNLTNILQTIERIRLRINNKVSFLTQQLCQVDSFVKLMSIDMQQIIDAPRLKQMYVEKIKNEAILPELDENNYPIKKYQSFLLKQLNNNPEAQNILLSKGHAFLNLLSEDQISNEVWAEFKITSEYDKLQIHNEAHKARQNLKDQQIQEKIRQYDQQIKNLITNSLLQQQKNFLMFSNSEQKNQEQLEIEYQ